MRILYVEDEPAIARAVQRGLEKAGFEVTLASDGLEGLRQALTGEYALTVLDLMLPGMDGMQICRTLREKRCSMPILMLTAKSAVPERVEGLEAGADDYLPKPFAFPELLARVQALLRREQVHRSRLIRIHDLEVDTILHRVSRAGRDIALSAREYVLLEALAANEGRVLSRDTIQERFWQDEDNFSNVVDVYIGLLRKKIDADFPDKLIHTVRGLGYTLRRPESEEHEQSRS